MAPKVCVPADFGRHHIGAPSHGNLTFNPGEGVQIKANSIILKIMMLHGREIVADLGATLRSIDSIFNQIRKSDYSCIFPFSSCCLVS